MEEDIEAFFNAVKKADFQEIDECLHLSVFQPKPGLIKFLLEKGVDADLGNDRGNTALHIASRKGFADVVLLLLEFGVDKDKRKKMRKLPCILLQN